MKFKNPFAMKPKDPNTPLTGKQRKWHNIWKNREFYMFIIPSIILAIIFNYIPMYGVMIAFKDVKIGQGFAGEWVGLFQFERLFNSGQFWSILRNTLVLNLAVLICTIPIPIGLALLLHNSPSKRLKSIAQTATYLPYLLSMVVIVSLMNVFCNGEFGLINILLKKFGFEKIPFFGDPDYVIPLYVISALWQSAGYNAIVYLAALTAIDESVVEAATIDGASKLQRMWHIDMKMILPTIVTMLLLNMGKIMTLSSMDKILLMQTPLNLAASETIATYVYKTGVMGYQYSFATAVGLFNNACNLIILFVANWVSKKVAKTSMF